MSIFESIKNEFRIPDAYDNWSTYREALTDIVIKDLDLDNKDTSYIQKDGIVHSHKTSEESYVHGARGTGTIARSIAVLGAGPCNDIDLSRLHDVYSHIELMDVDIDSMQDALERYGLRHSPKINLTTLSLTGLTQDITERFFNRLYMYLVECGRDITESSFIDRSLMEFRSVEDRLYKSVSDFSNILKPDSYDTVVAAGLHSQLWSILSYSWHILAGNVSEQILGGHTVDPEPLHDHIKELDDRIVPMLNEAIIRSSRERVIMASEYDVESPVEGAWQCVNDIRKRYDEGCIGLSESTLLWPFFPVQNRKYIMLVQDIVIR